MTDRPRRVGLDLRGLSGRVEIFRLSGAGKRDRAVDLWFTDGPPELRSIAHEWFLRIRQCGNDVRELMHDGCPVACVEDAAFAYVNAFKNHVNVGFFYGALLEDPARLLEGSGKRMRHVKLQPGREPNAAALGELIDAAYADVKARLGAERDSTQLMGAAATEIRRAQLSDAPEMTRLAALAGLLADERHFKGGPSGRAS